MRHSDRRVTKDIEKEQAARKKENVESVMSPKPSEKIVSRKKELSAESSTGTEPLVIGLSSIDVPDYLKKHCFCGLVIIRVVRKCRWIRFGMH